MATRYRARIVIEGDTKEVKKALRELEQQAGDTGVKVKQQFGRGIRGTEAEASSWASRMKKLLSPQNLMGSLGGLALGGGLFGVGSFFKGTINAAADFEKAMAKVSTIVDTNKVNMKELRDQVSDLAVEFGKPHVEQAEALYQILSAGITEAADAMHVLRVATKLGIAGVVDTETSVNAMTSIMNAFGIGVEDADHVADALFKTVERGKVELRDLGQFLGQAAFSFANVGLPFEEMLAGIATLTATSKQPSAALDALKSVVINVLKPSEQAKKTAHALGVEFSATALASKKLVGFLREIHTASKGNSEVFGQLFGDANALELAMALAGTQANRFESDLMAIKESAGATETALDKMRQTFSQNWDETTSLFEKIKIKLGNNILPILNFYLKELGSSWAEWLADKSRGIAGEFDKLPGDLKATADKNQGTMKEIFASLFTGAEEAGRASGAAWGRGLSPAAWGAAFRAANEDVPAGMRAGALASESQMGSAGRQAATPWVDAFLAKIRQAKDAVVGLFKSEPEPAPEKDPATFPGPSGGTGGQPPLRTTPSQILGGGAQTTTSPPLSKSPADILRDALTPKPGPVTTPVIPDDPDFYRTPDLEEQNRNSGGGGGGSGGPGGGLIRFMAHGGRRRLGGWSVVGEGGPELLRLPGGAEVIPNNLTQMAFKQGLGGASISLSIGSITVGGADSPAAARAIGNEIGSGILERLERLVNL